MIYFDNAATGGFKPRAVTDAVETVVRYLSANPTRSGHRLAITGAQTISKCRESLANMFGGISERVIFTKNCTEALNLAILGFCTQGAHVITTVYEHNSVLRPLFALKEKNVITLDVVSPKQDQPFAITIKEKIKPETKLIVATSVSNVTGYELPINEIAFIAKESGVKLLVDGAQGGGHVQLNLKKDGINMLALAGHKGLYGIMGIGALLFDESVELNPIIFGGTGNESFNLNQPSCYPERLESGTLNLPAIASLSEGVNYICTNLKNFSAHLYNATEHLINGLNTIKGVQVYSHPNRAGIVSFSIKNIPSVEVADILNSNYDVAVRGGLHCAPLLHKFLKTDDDGLVRVSLAVQNSTREINYFLSAVEKIAKSCNNYKS